MRQLLLLALCLSAAASHAQGSDPADGDAPTAQSEAAETPVDARVPDTLVHMLQGLGYRALLTTDGVGDPLIQSGSGGATFEIYFFDCDGGGICSDIMFSAGFEMAEPLQIETVNAWNADALVGRAYLDEAGDPYLEYYVVEMHNMAPETFVTLVTAWDRTLGDFTNRIGW